MRTSQQVNPLHIHTHTQALPPLPRCTLTLTTAFLRCCKGEMAEVVVSTKRAQESKMEMESFIVVGSREAEFGGVIQELREDQRSSEARGLHVGVG